MTLSFSEKRAGWWIEENATVPCAVSKDGAVVQFELIDVKELLDREYPHNGRVWWFNQTKDREIAEVRGKRVIANPQVLWRHFLPSGKVLKLSGNMIAIPLDDNNKAIEERSKNEHRESSSNSGGRSK